MKKGRVDRVHPIADSTEPRVVRALGSAFERIRTQLDVSALERRLRQGDARLIAEQIDRLFIEDALQPAVEIMKDAFVRGGKGGAEEVSGG